MNNMLSSSGIYVHIPFCRKKCDYCDFYSLPVSNESVMDDYLDALILQMKDYSLGGIKYPADTLYIGGGTPSLFGEKRLGVLIREIRKQFDLSEKAEITVEVNPESAGKSLFKALKRSGVNRISIGVQSSDNAQLAMLGRVHSYETAVNAVSLCREYCCDNISLDLIYGLPDQDLESWARSLKDIVSLEPKHISCYALTPAENTPIYKIRDTLPDDDVVADMYLYAVEALKRKGFFQYEVSNFSQKGYESKHNLKYWSMKPYIGLGAAAHSFFGNKRFSVIKDLGEYIRRMRSGDPVIEDADDTDCIDRVGEYIMLGLRKVSGIDTEDFYKTFGTDFGPYAERLEKYVERGYAVHEGSVFRLDPRGLFVSNTIISDVLDI